jgi:hypothetical protein
MISRLEGNPFSGCCCDREAIDVHLFPGRRGDSHIALVTDLQLDRLEFDRLEFHIWLGISHNRIMRQRRSALSQ